MKRIVLITILLPLLTGLALAQQPAGNDKLEAARIALITRELDLSPDQAEKFWPIYNEFKEKRQEMVRDFNQEHRKFDPNAASEKEKKAIVNRGLEVKQRQLDLEKEYSDRLMNVISTTQVLKLRQTEEKFRQLIIERLQQRGELRQQRMNRREEFQQRREEYQQRRSNN